MSAMSIGELAKRTAVQVETIRYYEKTGVMPAPPRTPGGYRMYDENHVQRLVFVRRSRELGFGLADVRRMLSLVDTGHVTCEQVRALAVEHLAQVRAKIADLRRMEQALERTAASCVGGSTPDCPIIDSLFQA